MTDTVCTLANLDLWMWLCARTYIIKEVLDTGGVPLPDGRQDRGDAVLVSGVHLGSLDRAQVDYII